MIFPPESSPQNTNLHLVPLAVGIAMIAAVMLANMIGSMLPFIFKRLGMDPAVTSGPFIACLMDVSSILIFFSIASGVLKIVA
jgi:magnesium transporter